MCYSLGSNESRSNAISDTNDTQAAENERIGLPEGKVALVPLDAIDLEDRTYMFRATLRLGPLVASIKTHGILVPVVLRAARPKYQAISGFRRIEAARRLGLPSVPAVVREELNDEQAFLASVLENCQRKTYSDIDRAHVIHEYRRRGHTNAAITTVMGLNRRQVQYLAGLLELPAAVQDAIDDPEQHLSTTHALVLKQILGDDEVPDYERWIRRVNEERLSVARLRRAVNRERATSEASVLPTIFRASDTDWEAGVIRLQPVKIRVNALTTDEKQALKAELTRLLAELG